MQNGDQSIHSQNTGNVKLSAKVKKETYREIPDYTPSSEYNVLF